MVDLTNKKYMRKTYNVCTYNVMIPVPEPIRFNGQFERSRRIKSGVEEIQSKVGDIDVLCFQEIMPDRYRVVVEDGMKEIGLKYITKPLTHANALADGGILICSRHPIVQQYHLPFRSDCISDECLCTKGAVYARVMVEPNMYINVVGLHTHAFNSARARHIRIQQIKEVRLMVEDMQLPPWEPLILIGDFNVDRYTQSDDMKLMERVGKIQFVNIAPTSHPYSSDPGTNKLMGNDSPSEYASKEFPNGCYEYFIQNGTCPCCPRELLDYAAFGTDSLNPVTSWSQVVPIKVTPFKSSFNRSKSKVMSDLSDHYPVASRLTFDMSETTMNMLPRVDMMNRTVDRGNRIRSVFAWTASVSVISLLVLTCVFIWYRIRLKSRWKWPAARFIIKPDTI